MLTDAMRNTDELGDVQDPDNVGKLFILRSTFVGGERYIRQNMHDAIAIAAQLGSPDIFLTMTCNPQ